MESNGPFGWFGRLVVGHPWLVIAGWILAAVAIVATSPGQLLNVSQSDTLPRSYESIRAQQLQEHAFPAAFHPSAIIVFQRRDGDRLTASDSAKVVQVAQKVDGEHIKNVQRVLTGPPSANGLVQTVGVQMPQLTNANYPSIDASVQKLRDDLKPLVAGTDLKAGTTGEAAMDLDQSQSGSTALTIIAVATVALIVALLLLTFRSPIIALLPIVVIAVLSQVAAALIGDAQHLFGLKGDSSTQQLLVVVLFGVGTDYMLFLLFRFRERLRAGDSSKQAMAAAVGRVGEVIACAAGVVIVAFMTLALSSLGTFRALGPSLAIAVAATLVTGLTLIPAVVSLLGPRVFWPSAAWKNEPKGARFAAAGRMVGRRTPIVAAISGLVLVGLALGALRFSTSFAETSGLPNQAESQLALRDLERGLPAGATEPTEVLLHSNQGRLDSAVLSGYARQLRAVHGVGQVAPAELSRDGTTAAFTVLLRDDPSSQPAMATVRALRQAAHAGAPFGTTALVGGVTAVYVDAQAATTRDYLIVFPVAAALVVVMLALLLRSLVAPWFLMLSVGLGF
ncbi:MAG: MMPL family transporter, partial [Candidatus Dormibacteraeota bacterium]|nr:MMPL family transporter [Candidatus Dormibacteraeota bacterium]